MWTSQRVFPHSLKNPGYGEIHPLSSICHIELDHPHPRNCITFKILSSRPISWNSRNVSSSSMLLACVHSPIIARDHVTLVHLVPTCPQQFEYKNWKKRHSLVLISFNTVTFPNLHPSGSHKYPLPWISGVGHQFLNKQTLQCTCALRFSFAGNHNPFDYDRAVAIYTEPHEWLGG